ncbi:MAG: hypothetical protein ACFB02_00145 [Mastigocoleus sp.]
MEQWQQEFWETVETVAEEVENFFWNFIEVTDNFIEFTEELIENFYSIDSETDSQYINDFSETFAQTYMSTEFDFDEFTADDLESVFPYKVEPTPEKNPACIACAHYHGQVYDENLLVCGMHPYGWSSDRNCPDWEKQESISYF